MKILITFIMCSFETNILHFFNNEINCFHQIILPSLKFFFSADVVKAAKAGSSAPRDFKPHILFH